MQYLATDSIFPEFKVFEKFVPETLIRVSFFYILVLLTINLTKVDTKAILGI